MGYRAFDIAAVVIVLFVVLLPTPTRHVRAEYEAIPREQQERLAGLQAEVVADPENLTRLVELTDELIAVGSVEAALRTILPVAGKHPDAFQVQLSTSDVYVQRMDFPSALPYAEAALTACKRDPGCNEDWRVRLRRYRDIVARVVAEQIDPEKDPDKIDKIVDEMYRVTRILDPRDADAGVAPPGP